MKNGVKKFIGILTVVALCLGMLNIDVIDAQAATSITGNNTISTAYNYGKWSSISSNYATIILEGGETESWLEFTLDPGEHIYLRASYNERYAGEWFEIQNAAGITQGRPQITPTDVYNADSVTPSIYLDCDNDSTSTRNYYLVLHRGSVDIDRNIYFSLDAYNRIKTSSVNVPIYGTASNPGNTSMSLSGVDSSVISENLQNNTKIPNGAIVIKISSSGTQSPRQGNVHHMIMPESNGTWYTSTVSSASSGYYNISLGDGIPVKQRWSFKYNAQASAKSTMTSVKLTIDFQYDLHNTGYEAFIR